MVTLHEQNGQIWVPTEPTTSLQLIEAADLWSVWPEKNRQMSKKLPKMSSLEKMIDFDTFTKIALGFKNLPKVQ